MDTRKNLLIIGAGQYGWIAKETAQAANCFDRIDFLDDSNPCAVGKIADYRSFTDVYGSALVAIGNPQLRLSWIEKLEDAGYHIPTLIHPMAYISPSAQLMKGTIAEPMAVVQANSMVGTGCLLCAGSVVNHNSLVEPGCQIDCNAVVASNAHVPAHTKVPCGTVYSK